MKTTDKGVYFWSGIYSQWNKSDFTIDGVKFTTAEQYMMYKKALLLEGQVAQLREQSCKELRTLHSTREAGLQATFATQLRNKLQILSQIEQKGQETVQRNRQQGLKYGVLEAFRQSKKTVGPQLLHQALEQLKQGQPK